MVQNATLSIIATKVENLFKKKQIKCHDFFIFFYNL